MKTNVSQTSIAVYHNAETQSMMQTQLQQVAAYVVSETKAGRPCCITSIWEHFAKQSTKGLGQTGTVSRVCNDLKELGVVDVGGKEYRYEAVTSKKHGRNVVKHFCLVLNHEAPETPKQTELFKHI